MRSQSINQVGHFRLQFLLACVLFFSGGCGNSVDYIHDTQQFSTSVVEQLDKEYLSVVHVEPETGASDQTVFLFQEACLRAALNDKRIVALLVELEKTNIDIDGARSYLLPRFNLSADADIPLASSSDVDSDLTGGIFVDYDIWRAVAVKDETVLRKAMAEKSLNQLKLAVNDLERTFLKHLREKELQQFIREKKQQALVFAQHAYDLAQVYAEQQRLGMAILPEWRSRIDTIEFEIAHIERKIETRKFAIADLMGFSISQQVTISDKGSVLQFLNTEVLKPLSPSEVWRKQSEARLYELELIAAEVAITLIELERLPRLNATLGVGNIPLERGGIDTASTLMRLSVTMPLIDMGDYQRKHAKSCIDRNRVKREMKLNAIRLWNRYQFAGNTYEMAETELDRVQKSLNKLQQQIDKKSMLISRAGGDGLSVYLDKIRLIGLEIIREQARVVQWVAADDLRFAAGVDIVQGSVDALIENLMQIRYGTVE